MRGRKGSFPSWSLVLLVAVMLTFPAAPGEAGGDDGSRATPPTPVEFLGFTDEFNDTTNVVLDGPVVLEDGYLTLDLPKAFSDDFERTDVAPWVVEAGAVGIENGTLKLSPSLNYDARVSRSINQDPVRLEGRVKCDASNRGGPVIMFKGFIHVIGFDYLEDKQRLRVWEEWPYSGFSVLQSVPFTMSPGRWYDFAVEYGGMPFRFEMGDVLIDNWTDDWDPNLLRSVELGSTSDGAVYFDDIVVLDSTKTQGTVTSVPIDLPTLFLWDELTCNYSQRPYEPFRMGVLDGRSLEPVPGFTAMWPGRLELEGLDFQRHPSIRLRAYFENDRFRVPRLNSWTVTWTEGGTLWMDGLDNGSKLGDMGRCLIDDGRLSADHLSWTDSFDRTDMTPWTWWTSSGGGSVSLEDGNVDYEGGPSPDDLTSLERDIDLRDFELVTMLNASHLGAMGFNITITTASGKGIRLAYNTTIEPWGRFQVYTSTGTFWEPQPGPFGYFFLNSTVPIRLRVYRTGVLQTDVGSYWGWTAIQYQGENYTNIRYSWGAGDRGRIEDVSLLAHYVDRTAVSEEVRLPEGMTWYKVRHGFRLGVQNGLTVDVLDGRTLEVVPGYAGIYSDTLDLRGVDPDRHPTLRLQARILDFTLDRGMPTPYLDWWQLWWQPGDFLFMDPFDDGALVNTTGDVLVRDGHVMTDNVLFEDFFERTDLGEWKKDKGNADILLGELWTSSMYSGRTTVQYDIPACDDVNFSFKVKAHWLAPRGLGFSLEFEQGGFVTVEYQHQERRLVLTGDDGVNMPMGGQVPFDMMVDTSYTVSFEKEGGAIQVNFGGVWLYAGRTTYFGSPQRVYLNCEAGCDVFWDNVVATKIRASGTALTEPFSLPPDVGYPHLEMNVTSTFGSILKVSLLDAETLTPLLGFSDLETQVVNLSLLDRRAHPKIRIRFELTGALDSVPSVDWYMLYRTNDEGEVVLDRPLDVIRMQEDLPVSDILNLTEHFGAQGVEWWELAFEVLAVSDPDRVSPYLEGVSLSIDLPTPNWSGNATFRLRCHHGDSEFVTGDIHVVVESVDDPPTIIGLEELDVTEDVPLVVDLREHILDIDTPDVWLSVSVDGEDCAVNLLDLTLFYTRGGTDMGILLLVSDNSTEVHHLVLVHVWETNDPPFIAPVPVQDIVEDQRYVVHLGCYVFDEDTPLDKLELECDHYSVFAIDGLDLTLLFPGGGGEAEVTFTVSDGGSTVSGRFLVRGEAVNDAPVILTVGGQWPPIELEVKEGANASFPIKVTDEEGDAVTLSLETDSTILSLTVDGRLMVLAPVDWMGRVTANLTATDAHGATATRMVVVCVMLVNDPPGPVRILSPAPGTEFTEGDTILFNAGISDPDMVAGQRLRVVWMSDISGELWNISSDNPMDFGVGWLHNGTHWITVTVSDGEFEVRDTVMVIVHPSGWVPPEEEPAEPEPGGTNWGLYIGLFVAVVILLVTVGLFVAQRARARRSD